MLEHSWSFNFNYNDNMQVPIFYESTNAGTYDLYMGTLVKMALNQGHSWHAKNNMPSYERRLTNL